MGMEILHSTVHVETIIAIGHSPTCTHPTEVKLKQLLACKDILQPTRPK